MNIENNKLLAPLTTFNIGGSARYFVSVKTIEDIKEAIEFAQKNSLKMFILGGGSNLLIKDKGFDGFVIKVDINFINFDADLCGFETRINADKNINLHRYNNTKICPSDARTDFGKKIVVEIGSGKMMTELVFEMCQFGYKGLEWAGGLPGTLGGAIRGNAGCFQGEIKDNILEVQVINLQNLEERIFENEMCEFGYRNSFFKQNTENEMSFSAPKIYNFRHPDWLIISAKIILTEGDKNELLKTMNEKIEYRKKFQPLEFPNAGSIFKNFPLERATEKLKNLAEEKKVIKIDPFPVIPTAFIVDECNLRGKAINGAKISEKHPNFILNFNNAKAQDVIDLINFVKDTVSQKFNIALEEEIQIL